MSPKENNSSNSFFVHETSEYSIIPSNPSCVSISTENFLIFFIIEIFQFIDFSKLYFYNPSDHLEL